MLLKDNKKGLVTIIMKRMKSPNMESESCNHVPMENGAEQDNSDGLNAAAESMISAIHSKDARSLKSALQSFISMIEDSESESESEND